MRQQRITPAAALAVAEEEAEAEVAVAVAVEDTVAAAVIAKKLGLTNPGA